MPRLAANLSMLFTEVDFADRFEAAAKAGFTGVEYWFPYDYEPEALKALLEANKLQQVLFNLPAGDWQAGERGIACHPDRIDEFRAGVDLAIRYARLLGNRQVNCLAGILPDGVDQTCAHDCLIDNLRYAAARLQDANIRLLIEAINTRDVPGFFLNHTAQAVAIRQAVGSSNLQLQYDIYHMQIMEGDLATTLLANLEAIGHIQLADNPGRHEPGTGEINYPFLLDVIDRSDYHGWIGCEYQPLGSTDAGLDWLKQYN